MSTLLFVLSCPFSPRWTQGASVRFRLNVISSSVSASILLMDGWYHLVKGGHTTNILSLSASGVLCLP